MLPALVLFPSGCGEAGAGSRERLPHGEGEANRLELLPAPYPYPALHLRGPRLERFLLVNCPWGWPRRGLSLGTYSFWRVKGRLQ